MKCSPHGFVDLVSAILDSNVSVLFETHESGVPVEQLSNDDKKIISSPGTRIGASKMGN